MARDPRRAPVVFLMGPTATGKTDLAVALVERLPLDIVSVDSAMVYRGLDIGTGKPDAATLARAPHRLIDIRDPAEPYSAAQFRDDALREIRDIQEHGRTALLVGGTGLYFRALRDGLSPLPGADPALRHELESQARACGWPALHARLVTLDPVAAARIGPDDSQRIQRALEVIAITGTPISALQRSTRGVQPPLPTLSLSLEPESRGWLHRRIARRFDAMLAAGFENEVCALIGRGGLSPTLPAMRAVGYRQMIDYLEGRIGRTEMVARAVAATRQLARRQLTWLRKEPLAARLAPDRADCLARLTAMLGPVVGG